MSYLALIRPGMQPPFQSIECAWGPLCRRMTLFDRGKSVCAHHAGFRLFTWSIPSAKDQHQLPPWHEIIPDDNIPSRPLLEQVAVALNGGLQRDRMLTILVGCMVALDGVGRTQLCKYNLTQEDDTQVVLLRTCFYAQHQSSPQQPCTTLQMVGDVLHRVLGRAWRQIAKCDTLTRAREHGSGPSHLSCALCMYLVPVFSCFPFIGC
jgi:hypothetical protein